MHRSTFGDNVTAAPSRRLQHPARRGARTLGYFAGSLLALATMCASPGNESTGQANAGEKAGGAAGFRTELATLERRCFDHVHEQSFVREIRAQYL